MNQTTLGRISDVRMGVTLRGRDATRSAPDGSCRMKVNQSEINDVAWRACDTFRGVVDAENYRNYILVMLFWKYGSTKKSVGKNEPV